MSLTPNRMKHTLFWQLSSVILIPDDLWIRQDGSTKIFWLFFPEALGTHWLWHVLWDISLAPVGLSTSSSPGGGRRHQEPEVFSRYSRKMMWAQHHSSVGALLGCPTAGGDLLLSSLLFRLIGWAAIKAGADMWWAEAFCRWPWLM